MGALNTTVHVLGDDGAYHVYGPDDDVPDEHLKLMGAHCFEDGEHPLGDVTGREEGTEPPRSGKGSGRDAWVAFAHEKGLEVDDEATRDQIIADLAADGTISE